VIFDSVPTGDNCGCQNLMILTTTSTLSKTFFDYYHTWFYVYGAMKLPFEVCEFLPDNEKKLPKKWKKKLLFIIYLLIYPKTKWLPTHHRISITYDKTYPVYCPSWRSRLDIVVMHPKNRSLIKLIQIKFSNRAS